MTPAVDRTRPVRQLPEPGRFWIAYAPRNWRAAASLWTNLASSRVDALRGAPSPELPELETDEVDDLLYLPPVSLGLVTERNRMAVSVAETGAPVLAQLIPGDGSHLPGVHVVYDLLRPLLEGDVDALREVPEGGTAVWPLIGGLTDQPDIWEEGCLLLVEAGAKCVQGVTVELSPPVRRQLAEGRDNEDVFEALFHGDPPSEREFSIHAARHGLEVFFERPATGVHPRQVRNRRIAAHLALVGELSLRLRRPVSVGQAFYRAARGVESTHHDIRALVAEDNLGQMTWLDAQGQEVVEDFVGHGRSSHLRELLDEYLEL